MVWKPITFLLETCHAICALLRAGHENQIETVERERISPCSYTILHGNWANTTVMANKMVYAENVSTWRRVKFAGSSGTSWVSWVSHACHGRLDEHVSNPPKPKASNATSPSCPYGPVFCLGRVPEPSKRFHIGSSPSGLFPKSRSIFQSKFCGGNINKFTPVSTWP